MAGGRLPEKENKIIFQISGLKSGHSHLRNLVVLACERGFLRQYLTEKQNSHLQSGCFTGGGRLREGIALITYLNDICSTTSKLVIKII